jgi:hypothetical protein
MSDDGLNGNDGMMNKDDSIDDRKDDDNHEKS